MEIKTKSVGEVHKILEYFEKCIEIKGLGRNMVFFWVSVLYH
jgi:hypothetical protein